MTLWVGLGAFRGTRRWLKVTIRSLDPGTIRANAHPTPDDDRLAVLVQHNQGVSPCQGGRIVPVVGRGRVVGLYGLLARQHVHWRAVMGHGPHRELQSVTHSIEFHLSLGMYHALQHFNFARFTLWLLAHGVLEITRSGVFVEGPVAVHVVIVGWDVPYGIGDLADIGGVHEPH